MKFSEVNEDRIDELLPNLTTVAGGLSKGATAVGGAIKQGTQAIGGIAKSGVQAAGQAISGLMGGGMNPAQAAAAKKERDEQKKQVQDQIKQTEQQLQALRKQLADLA